MIKHINRTTDTENGPERSTMFYLGLGASLREGFESYIYMVPLGGSYEAKNLPLPAVLGEQAAAAAATSSLWGLFLIVIFLFGLLVSLFVGVVSRIVSFSRFGTWVPRTRDKWTQKERVLERIEPWYSSRGLTHGTKKEQQRKSNQAVMRYDMVVWLKT